MTAVDARAKLRRLGAERVEAMECGLDRNGAYWSNLLSEMAACRELYIGLAVTEIASLRAALSGRQEG